MADQGEVVGQGLVPLRCSLLPPQRSLPGFWEWWLTRALSVADLMSHMCAGGVGAGVSATEASWLVLMQIYLLSVLLYCGGGGGGACVHLRCTSAVVGGFYVDYNLFLQKPNQLMSVREGRTTLNVVADVLLSSISGWFWFLFTSVLSLSPSQNCFLVENCSQLLLEWLRSNYSAVTR